MTNPLRQPVNEPLKEIMVDIETLGNGPNGMIVQIGACRFDPFVGDGGYISSPEGHFTINIKPTGKPQVDGEMEAGTVWWWLRQGPEAQARVFSPAFEAKDDIAYGVNAFALWLDSQGPFKHVWANSPNFDLRLLKEAFRRTQSIHGNADWPISFRAERDFRTLRHVGELLGVAEPLRVGVQHDALDDALHQAGWAITIMRAAAAAKGSK